MIKSCERCGTQTAKLETCGYCDRNVCESCIKNSKRKKIGRRFICKDCWGDMEKRKRYKSSDSTFISGPGYSRRD
ncbi:TPA: hypothetical protein EYP38_02405 [Candidatus Micrarchaeota archaeon]|nr:hypothetical protein [Candidatus Micrarchaeota archaeon]